MFTIQGDTPYDRFTTATITPARFPLGVRRTGSSTKAMGTFIYCTDGNHVRMAVASLIEQGEAQVTIYRQIRAGEYRGIAIVDANTNITDTMLEGE